MKTRFETSDAVGVRDLCKTKATTFCGNVNFNEKNQAWEFLHFTRAAQSSVAPAVPTVPNIQMYISTNKHFIKLE